MSSLRHLRVLAPGARANRVFVALVFVQLALHLFTAFSSHDPRLLPPHLVAWLHDTLVLSVLVGLSWLCLRLLPSRVRPAGEGAAAAAQMVVAPRHRCEGPRARRRGGDRAALAAAGRQQPERGAGHPFRECAARCAEASARAASPKRRVANAKTTHLFLIVLEGVTAEKFEKEFMHGRSSRFYGRVAKPSIYFANYYTNNLDAYTSLIAMLTSQQVPYRSYTDTTLYDAVNQSASLARDFRQSGFRSCFVSTYDTQPFVPVRKDWTGILHRRDLPTHGE